MMGDHRHVLAGEVPADVMKRLAEPHTKDRPRIPFAWMISYDAASALQNIRVFENGSRHCALDFPVRVFLSTWTSAIVVSFVPLSAIREPHVLEWYTTFYEVMVGEAKQRLTTYPEFPYDGRKPDPVRADIIARGGPQALIDDARRVLAAKGIDIPRRF